MGSDIDIKLTGTDLESVRKASDQIVALMKKNEKLTNVKVDLKTGLPQIEIEIDRKRANSLGVSVEAAANESNSCISGVVATKYHQKGNEYNVIVSLQNKDKQSLIDLDKIMVQGTNVPVRLGNFAKLKKGFGAVSLKHENKERTVHITASFVGQQNAFEMENQIKNEVSTNCFIPSDVIVSFGGSSAMMKEKRNDFCKNYFSCNLYGFWINGKYVWKFEKAVYQYVYNFIYAYWSNLDSLYYRSESFCNVFTWTCNAGWYCS